MSKGNNESFTGCCLRFLFWAVVLSLLFVWCRRTDDKSFIDSSIEQVHNWYNHADSVCNEKDTIR